MYGPTIKKIRLSKNISLKTLYTGICSKTNAIDFEKGNRMLSASKFNQVLDNLMITMEEFLWIDNGYKPTKNAYFRYVIGKAWNKNELSSLDSYVRYLDSRSDNFSKVQLASYHLLCNYGKGRLLQPKDINLISNYFQNLSLWTKEDLVFFANTCYLLPYELMLNLLDEAISAKKRYKNYSNIDHIFATILVNCLEKAFDHNDFIKIKKLLITLKKFTSDATMTSYKLFEKYYSARLLYQSDPESGQQELQKVLEVANYLDNKIIVDKVNNILEKQISFLRDESYLIKALIL